MSAEIFVADLGRPVNIRRGSRFEKLLWRVTDLRELSRERMRGLYASRLFAHGDNDTINHVFFSCPEAAARAYGYACASEDAVYKFYKERDALLASVLKSDDHPWWNTTTFDSKVVRKTVGDPLKPWEFQNKMIRQGNGWVVQRPRATHADPGEFLED